MYRTSETSVIAATIAHTLVFCARPTADTTPYPMPCPVASHSAMSAPVIAAGTATRTDANFTKNP